LITHAELHTPLAKVGGVFLLASSSIQYFVFRIQALKAACITPNT